jgi:hypothetical protein
MSTNVNTATAAPATTAKPSKSFSISLHSADGAVLRITAIRRQLGAATYVVKTTNVNGKRKNERGMTTAFPSLDQAKTAVTKLAADAIKMGWQQRIARGGFKARPDAFTTLPAPSAAPTTPAKTNRKR